MTNYETLSHWNAGRKTSKHEVVHEQWYNLPGTSPYELNMNVSAPQGPHFGPKGALSTSSQVAVGWVAIVILLLLIGLVVYFKLIKKHSTYYF